MDRSFEPRHSHGRRQVARDHDEELTGGTGAPAVLHSARRDLRSVTYAWFVIVVIVVNRGCRGKLADIDLGLSAFLSLSLAAVSRGLAGKPMVDCVYVSSNSYWLI